MTTTFENKAKIVHRFHQGYFDDTEFDNYFSEYAVGVDNSHKYVSGESLADYDLISIEIAFLELLDYLGVVDTGFENVSDFFLPNYDGED